MKNFLIEFDYEGRRYECFVQPLADQSEKLFIVNFKDTALIRRFNVKKMIFSANRTSDHINILNTLPVADDARFEKNICTALEQKISAEQSKPAGKTGWLRWLNL